VSVFRDAEIEYLGSQRLGRLATVGRDGMPHVVPVAFRYNPETDTIDIGGHDFAKRKKFRDVKRTGMAALVVDDVLPHGSRVRSRCAARRAPSTPAARSSWRTSTTRSSGSHCAGSSPGAWRTASRRVRWSDPTSDRQLGSLVLGVDLVGSRPIWPAHVGRVLDLVGSRRVRRVVWMIKRMIKQVR
jgi:pyridoxamine 5'-phosphate oxidase family protein